jgi:NADPH2:quinone reductase
MDAWRFHEFGPIKNLTMEAVDVPVPAKDEVLVKLEYAGLNPADTFLIMGRYSGAGQPPFAVGRDGCGVVVDTNANDNFKVGDRVVFLSATVGISRDGTLAEYVAMPENHLALLPSWWSPQEGAAGTKVFLTCWQALADTGKLQPGENLVITGAAGGVGLAALAIAKAMGATTVALSRSADKRAKLLRLGADHVFDPSDPDLAKEITELGGADVILEMVGGSSLAQSLAMANPFGRICIIGALGGIKCEINPLQILFKRLQIHGIQVSMYSEAESQSAFDALCQLLEPSKTKPLVDKIFPFAQVQEAFAYLRDSAMGKVVVGPIGE